jgi:NADPH:quinone reductase-like Zn-dependent oxidoreductase
VTATLVATVRRGGALITIASAPPEEAGERGVRAEAFSSKPDPVQLAQLAELVAAGELRVELAEIRPLPGVRRAHELSESGHTRGKIVLTP